MKKIWVITLFPDFLKPIIECGIISNAFKQKFELKTINLREYSNNNYKGVDDSPFGGGAGMVIKADILKNALEAILNKGKYSNKDDLEIIFPTPRGIKWTGEVAKGFAKNYLVDSNKDLVFICGRYEGIDERFIQKYVNSFYSIGDFILSGGEIAVMSILDSSLRFVPGILGNQDSLLEESFENHLLEYPVYTRPREFEGLDIPEELVSGSHARIKEFKIRKREELTQKHRPDLWKKYQESQK